MFSGGKTRKRAVDTRGISGFSFPRFDSNSRIGATGVGGEGGGAERSPPSLHWKITYGQPRAEVLRYRDTRADTDSRAGRTCACSVQFYMQFRGGRRPPQDGGVFNYI